MRGLPTVRGFANGSMKEAKGGGGRIPSRSWEGSAGTSGRPRCVRMPVRSLPFAGEFAALGLTPIASQCDVKRAYKRLALKYHPDVIRVNVQEKEEIFREIKLAYERLMVKFEEEQQSRASTIMENGCGEGDDDDDGDEWEEWEEWMGLEGGLPVLFNAS